MMCFSSPFQLYKDFLLITTKPHHWGHAREESYLSLSKWGDLVIRGKSLKSWKEKEGFSTKWTNESTKINHVISKTVLWETRVSRGLPLFPHIVSAETSFFDLEIVANSNSCRNISIFLTYKINLFFAAETIQGRKLYEELR
jgi:hypothetical protein